MFFFLFLLSVMYIMEHHFEEMSHLIQTCKTLSILYKKIILKL